MPCFWMFALANQAFATECYRKWTDMSIHTLSVRVKVRSSL